MGLNKSQCTPKKLKSWIKTFLVHLFSHVGLCLLIVSYAVGGAFIFEHLESKFEKAKIDEFLEKKDKFNFTFIKHRHESVAKLWQITDRLNVLYETNWTLEVEAELEKFGQNLIKEYASIGNTTRNCNHTLGWMNTNFTEQWTFTQALLYSVSIITTIGYGNTAPETDQGRIFTMFYAVLGVPLMLLWVSNIGNLMAKTFKFGYFHAPYCGFNKKRNSIKKAVQTSSPSTKRRKSSSRNKNKFMKSPTSVEVVSTQLEYCLGDETIETKIVEPINSSTSSSPKIFKRSLSNRSSTKSLRDLEPGAKQVLLECAEYNMTISQGQDERSRRILQQLHPSFTNKAIVEGNEDGDEEDSEDRSDVQSVIEVTSTIPQINSTYGPIPPPLNFDEVDQVHEINAEPMYPSSNFYGNGNGKLGSRKVSVIETLEVPYGTPSKVPLLMDTTGVENNIIDIENIEPDICAKEIPLTNNGEPDRVPVSLVLFVVVLYLCLGALMFDWMEGWGFLKSAYFCFITLSTIGLGDIVPGKSLQHSGTREATYQLLFCCFYLVIGLAIIAMSFNLVQEQVTIKVRDFARRIGIIEEKYI